MSDIPSLNQLSKMAESLRGANLRSRSVDSIKVELSEFLRGYRLLGIGRSSHQMWYRARLCETSKGYSSLHEMIYPSSGSPDFGRAQLPGSSVLYASWNVPTALDEVGAQPGDHVQLISLRPIANIDVPCHVVGEYQRFFSSGRSWIYSEILANEVAQMQATNFNEFMRCVFIDSVISELFRYQVKRPFEYKITAAYSELLHLAQGGTIYPSVESFGAINIAIPAKVFDLKFEVVNTEVYKIEEAFGYGLYSLSPLRLSCDFQTSGDINWESKMRRDFQWNPQEGLRERQPSPGWRKAIPDNL